MSRIHMHLYLLTNLDRVTVKQERLTVDRFVCSTLLGNDHALTKMASVLFQLVELVPKDECYSKAIFKAM